MQTTRWLASPSHSALTTRQDWLADRMKAMAPGVAHTIVEPGFFADMPCLATLEYAAHLGIYPWPFSERPNAPPAVEEVAAVAAGVLANASAHAGRRYRPTGPELPARWARDGGGHRSSARPHRPPRARAVSAVPSHRAAQALADRSVGGPAALCRGRGRGRVHARRADLSCARSDGPRAGGVRERRATARGRSASRARPDAQAARPLPGGPGNSSAAGRQSHQRPAHAGAGPSRERDPLARFGVRSTEPSSRRRSCPLTASSGRPRPSVLNSCLLEIRSCTLYDAIGLLSKAH